jgi:hypothetical protein
VVRDRLGLQRGLERVVELRQLAGEVDVRPISEGYGDLAHALDLRASLAAAAATLLGALARTESRGAHQRRDHPQLSPELRVNFQTRLDSDGRLTTAMEPVPPIPPNYKRWPTPPRMSASRVGCSSEPRVQTGSPTQLSSGGLRYRPPGSPVGSVGLRRQGTSS